MSFEEIGSTNEYVRRNLTLKEFEVVVAKKQTDDKLKKMNIWISDKGGAFFSFWIQDKSELQEKIEIFSCYIVYEIIKEYIKESSKNDSEDESKNLKFKWPNDIYYKDKKISSIFCEKVRNKIIIGVRINVNRLLKQGYDKAEYSYDSWNGGFKDILEVTYADDKITMTFNTVVYSSGGGEHIYVYVFTTKDGVLKFKDFQSTMIY